MKGNVEQVTKSKTGKSWRVMIASQWYGAKFDSKLDQAIGKTIDFTVESDPKFGNWIQSWDFDPNPPAAVTATTAATSQANGKPDRWWINFTSNCVAHAIQAGLIKEPSQLQGWCKAARHAIEVADESDVF